MALKFDIKIDVSKLDGLQSQFEQLSPAQLGAHLVDAINETADSAYVMARTRMLTSINLTDDYVQRKMRVEHATESAPVASIIASGAPGDMTSLSHYGAMQLTKADNWSNARITAAGHKFAPWRGWTRRTGNAALGIAVDTKAAGKTVEVTRGKRMKLGSQFSIPGKKDNDGDLIIFRRLPSGKLQALNGPSVYQLFRVAAAVIEDDVYASLEDAVAAAAEREIDKALS